MDFRKANLKARTCHDCDIDYPVEKRFEECGCGEPTVIRELPWGEKPLPVQDALLRRNRLRDFHRYCDQRALDNHLMRVELDQDPAGTVADMIAGFELLLDDHPPV